MSIINIISSICIIVGLIFLAISALGLFRFPDFYTRLHSAGIGDTLGLLLIITGFAILCGFRLITVKLFLVFGLIMLTNPVGTNLITMVGVHFHDYQNYNEKVRITDEEEDR